MSVVSVCLEGRQNDKASSRNFNLNASQLLRLVRLLLWFDSRTTHTCKTRSSEQRGAQKGLKTAEPHITRVTAMLCIQAELWVISDIISSWFENHQPERTKNCIVTNVPSNRLASSVDRNRNFSRAYFSTPAIFEANVKVFELTGLLWWQKLTWRSSIFFKICRFHSWILRSLFSLHDWSDACFKLKVAWFSWIDHSSFVM